MTFKFWIPVWLFSQLFWYQYMTPDLSFSLGIRISPDRLIFFIILVTFIRGIRRAGRIGGMEACMILFTLLATGSWILSGSDSDGSRFRWLTTLFQLTYFPFTIFYVAKNGLFTTDDIKKLLKGLLAIQIYLVVSGICEHYRIDFLVWPKYILDESLGDQWERLRGPFVNSSFVGAALVLTSASTSLMSLYLEGTRKRLLQGVLLATGVCVYFTYTRTVWLGFFMTLVIFFISQTGLRRLAGSVLIAVLIAFVLGPGSKLSLSGNTLFDRRQNTVDYRVSNIRLAYRVFLSHPVFGLGYGKFGKELKSFEDSYSASSDTELTSGNENTVFGLLTEVGLVGFSLYAMILFLAWRSCVKTYRNWAGSESIERALPVVGIAMITYCCLNSMTGDLRFHLFTHNILFLILGLVAGIPAKPNHEHGGQFRDEMQNDGELATVAAQAASAGRAEPIPI